MKKRLVSMALAAAMAVSAVPVSFAEASGGEDVSEDVLIEEIQTPEPEGPAEDAAEEAEVSADEAETEPLVTDEPEETAEETAAPEEAAGEEEFTLYENMEVELFATGTYYEEYGIWFDTSSGTITDADEGLEDDLYIPESIDGVTVTVIGNNAFQNCVNLTGVNIPKTVTNIGNYAFQNCTSLSNVTMNYNDTRQFSCSIGNYAFIGCSSLTELEIPDSVTYLGCRIIEGTAISSITVPKSITGAGEHYGGPFANCVTLSYVTIEDGMTSIPNYLFAGVNYVSEIIIPESVTSIGRQAFYACSSLKAINIPKAVRSIGEYAFQNCTSLSGVTLNYNDTREFSCSIGNYAFIGCSSLTELEIPESVTSLGCRIIEGTAITSITVPKSIKSAGANYGGPFANCTTLNYITIEDGMTSIPNNLFDCVKYVSEIIIPESVTSIGRQAFTCCYSLKSINIPKAVKSIGEYAFQNCTSLSDVTMNYNDTREFSCSIGNYAFIGCSLLTELEIPESVTSLGCRIIEGTAITSITVPKSIKSAGANYGGPFANCTTLNYITIEDGMTSIPNNLFDCVKYVSEIIIPESVTSIGRQAFTCCYSLKSINIPKAVKSIGEYAFQNCTSLSDVTMNYNDSREFSCSIGNYAFIGCSSLTELELPGSVTHLGCRIIEGTSISSITVPKSIKSVGANYGGPFANCTSLSYITIEDGITSLPNHIFDNVKYVDEIVIPESVTSIGNNAFERCTSLKEINIPKDVSSIGEKAFQNCSNLRNVTLNYNSAREFSCRIGNYAFTGCTSLTSLTIPQSVTYLGTRVIENTGISSITIPKSVTSVGNGALAGNINLDNVYFEMGTTAIPDGICNCNNTVSYISKIEIPSTVTSIGKNAFYSCTRLENVNLPDSVTSIRENAFYNCPKLTVYCNEYTPAIANLIDSNVRFSIVDEISWYDNLIFESTDYTSSINQMTGYVPFEIKYETAVYGLTDKKLVVRIPSSSELVESTLMLDGVLLTDYEYKNGLLTVPVEPEKATLTFCVKPTQYTTLLTYARMDMQKNGAAVSEMIGVLNCSVPDISVKTDSVTNDRTVTVEGIAPPSGTVEFYIGDTRVGSTAAVKSGNYKTTVELPSTEDYKTYTIIARAYKGDQTVEAEGTVMYREAVPSLSSLVMYYGDHTSIHRYDLTNKENVKPTIVFFPKAGFKFEAKFENADGIGKVYIVSTRNNIKKYMQAYFDEASGCYVAEGHFEGTDPSSYVPGEITVEYLPKSEPYLFGEEIDFSAPEYVNTMPDAWDGHTVTISDGAAEVELTEASLDRLEGVIDLVNDIKEDLKFRILSETLPEYLSRENAEENGYTRVVDAAGEELYIKLAEMTEDKIYAEVADFADEKISSFLIENGAYEAAGILGSASAVLGGLDTVDKLITYDKNRVSIESARQAVINSSDPPEYKEYKLERLDIAEKSNNAEIAMLLLSTALTVSGIGVPAVCSVVIAALSYQNTMEIEYALGADWEDYLMHEAMGIGYGFNWSVDPSGYVYEAVTTNRIEGVTASAYWIAPAYIDENGKGDTSKAVLWDASEYAQINPLVTDMNGAYAWDVPEGLWQVRFEKDGYEPQSSEWLPVPPPQTEVNIGLVSKAVPKVESAALTDDRLTITFDKYMKPDTVKDVAIDGYTYTMDYNKNETAPDGTVYAREYVFKLNRAVPEGEEIDVSVSGAESYAGVMMQSYSGTVTSAVQESVRTVSIENAAAENGTVTADFVNLTDDYGSFEAVCAVYDKNGALVGVKTGAVVALDGGARTKKTFVFDEEWESCKLFAWDSTETMNALAAAAGV